MVFTSKGEEPTQAETNQEVGSLRHATAEAPNCRYGALTFKVPGRWVGSLSQPGHKKYS